MYNKNFPTVFIEPFYPMVLRFVKAFLPDRFTTNQIGILVSNLCTLIAGYTAVAAVRIKYPKDEGYLIDTA